MFLIKNLISIPITILGYFYFLITKNTPNFVYQCFIISYCFLNGKIVKILKTIDFFIFRKQRFNYKGINPKLNFNLINTQLKEKGYYVFPNKLNNKIIDDLLIFSKKEDCYYYDDFGKKRLCKFKKKINKKNYHSSKYSYFENLLIKFKPIRKILLDNNNLLISYNYFKNKPYFSNINMWWSTARERRLTIKNEKFNRSAQFFHFDLDRPKWLKLFIYLSDVDKYSGPHEYVEGSHKILGKPKKVLAKGYQRIGTGEIAKFYKKKKIKRIVGKKGTMFIADTSCFHRGIPPLKKNRLILVIEYSNSLFGAKILKINKKIKQSLTNSNLIVD
jgi:hypothetical protein